MNFVAKNLSDKQKLFLEVLFHEGINGDVQKAKVAAGYSSTYANSSLIASLKDEILERTKDYLVSVGPQAAMSLSGVLRNPTELGARNSIAAAKDILDRMGAVRSETVNLQSDGIFILPPKGEG